MYLMQKLRNEIFKKLFPITIVNCIFSYQTTHSLKNKKDKNLFLV